MRIQPTWLASGFVAALVCVAACSESSTDTDPAAGGGSSAVPRFGTSPCAQCVATACANERSVCLSEPSCAAYASCVDQCELADSGNVEPNCELACPDATDPAGSEAQFDLSECRLNGIGADCPECGIVSSSDHPVLNQTCSGGTSDEACGICLGDYCCSTMGQCALQSACIHLNDCVTACPGTDVPCHEECFAQYETGMQRYLDMTACSIFYCYEACVGDPGDPCTDCGRHSCTNSWLACDLDGDCFLYGLCIAGCPFDDGECYAACKQGVGPETVATFDAHKLCLDHACSAECAALFQ